MANLIGEPFEGYVANQINVRQKIHGSGMEGTSRTPEQLAYLNSKTAWIKLASGVFVDSDRIKKLGFSSGFSGKELAKNFVLQGGVNRIDNKGKSNFRGINPDGGDRNGVWDHFTGPYNVNANGQNNDLEFGLVPMPGIETADIKFLNRGSIKRATVKIKAHNKAQFDIIDALYLRLGYSVLLEWGNSMYVKDIKTNNLITNYNTLIDNNKGWFSEKFSQASTSQILNAIRAYRVGKSGNYDGMFGKVSNFSWSFNNDGSYDIELKLISHGDIIESLKLNTVPNPELSTKLKAINEQFKSDLGEDDQALSDEPNPQDNILSAYLFLQKVYVYQGYQSSNKNNNYFVKQDIYYKDPDGGENGTKGVGIFVLPPKNGKIDIDIEEYWYWTSEYKERREELEKEYADVLRSGEVKFGPFDSGLPESVTETVIDAASTLGLSAVWDLSTPYLISLEGTINLNSGVNLETTAGAKDVIYMNYIEEDDRAIHGKGFYMRFGHLLQFIETNAIPKVKPKGGGKEFPLLRIYTEKWKSKMLYYPNQTSLDPRVCVVNSDVDRYKIFDQLIPWSNKSKGYAWPMNIYINHNTIQNAISENLDDQGNLAFFPMISSICTELNKALGGINNLEPVIDESEGILKIIDSSYAADKTYKPPSPPYQIETFGYNNKNKTSNFLRNIDLKTEITKEYASMITIGATAGGYVKGTEATAFSKWSEGYIDRFKEKILPPTDTTNPSENEAATNYFENYFNTGIDLMLGYKYIDVDDDVQSPDAPQLQDDIIDSNIAIVTEYYRYINEKAREANKGFASKTNGFIPFNLGLTLDGISGIKIYNKINVDTRFLPQNYPDALQFIIKGVNHKLSNNDWETQLETQAIPETLDNKPSYDLLASILAADIAAKGKKVEYKSIVDSRPKDQDGNNNYTPGGNPTYTPVSPYTPVKTAPPGWNGLSTLTSGFPMKKRQYSTKIYQKTQIYLHYSAGHQKSDKGAGTANTLFKRGNVSCHAIIDIDGHIERMIPDEYKANCQGGGSSRRSGDIYPNQTGLSIEIDALGYERGTGKNPNFNAYGKGQPLVGSVDWQGNPIDNYKGFKKYQDFSDAQIGATRELCMDWLKNHNIEFKWSKDTYDNMFPPKGTISREVMAGKPGIWSHNSVSSGKYDVSPTLKVINMLKSISDEVNGPTKTEIEDAAEEIKQQQVRYNRKIHDAADKLYSVMEGYDDNTKVVIDKLVRETTPDFRKDVRTYFDSFARAGAPAYGTPTRERSGWRLATDIPNNLYKQGRWLSNNKSYTDKQGNAPSRSPSNKYDGYTLNEWIIGDFYGDDEAKYLSFFK